MKNLIIVITMFIFASTAFSKVLQEKPLRWVDNAPNAIDGVFIGSTPSAHYVTATDVSHDPFSTKTNKYAESKLISAISTNPFIMKFGASTITDIASTDAGVFVPANTRVNIGVDSSYPYVRVIHTDAASSSIYFSEVY